MEEFSPKLEYIQGEKNVVADTLSRLGRKEDISSIVGKNDAPSSDIKNDSLDSFFSTFDETELVECFNSVLSTETNLL